MCLVFSLFITGGLFMGRIYTIGAIVIFGMKLQLYFLQRVLKGGIIFGIFPGILVLYRVISLCLEAQTIDDITPSIEMKKLTKKEMIQVNMLGYMILGLSFILLLNRQFSIHFIRSPLLHYFILFVLLLTLATGLYMIPLLAKYELPMKQYILQSFLLCCISIFDIVAILLGTIFALIVAVIFPPIAFFTGIPLVMLPYVWFSRMSIRRLEVVIYKQKNEKKENIWLFGRKSEKS